MATGADISCLFYDHVKGLLLRHFHVYSKLKHVVFVHYQIFNGRGRNNAERTDRFINGQAVGISGGPWWKVGISTPMSEDFLSSLSTETPFAIEVGLGTPGIDASFAEVFGDKEVNPVKFLKQINKENEALILEHKLKNLDSQGKGWGNFADEFGRLF